MGGVAWRGGKGDLAQPRGFKEDRATTTRPDLYLASFRESLGAGERGSPDGVGEAEGQHHVHGLHDEQDGLVVGLQELVVNADAPAAAAAPPLLGLERGSAAAAAGRRGRGEGEAGGAEGAGGALALGVPGHLRGGGRLQRRLAAEARVTN